MIIHNMEWVRRLRVVREAKQWRSSGIISAAQYDAIKAQYTTPLYTPTLFIRIVLFVFTCIALLGVYGIIFLAVSPSKDSAFAFFFVVTGILSFIAMEAVIKQRKLYEAGMEEALLYAALCLTIGGIVWLYTDAAYAPRPGVIPWIIALPFLLFGAIRYADRLVTAAAFACILAIVLVPLWEGGPIAGVVLPFAAMGAAALTYILLKKYGKRKSLEPWKECVFVVELLALVAFYCGGNYYIVREGNEMLMGTPVPVGHDIPFAFLFYALTILIPVIYVARGLLVRDHMLLRTGLLAAVASVLTFRYYYAVVPPETALTIAGAALFLIAVLSIRYLKRERNGFTHRNILKEKLKDVNVEGLLISQTLGPAPQAVKKESGGGEFGGGGATGSW